MQLKRRISLSRAVGCPCRGPDVPKVGLLADRADSLEFRA